MTGTVIPIKPSIPDLRQKVDRILESVWAPPDAPVENPDDTVLIVAAREFRRLQRFEDWLNRTRAAQNTGRRSWRPSANSIGSVRAGMRFTSSSIPHLRQAWSARR